MKHVHLKDGFIEQDPKEVDTKFSKEITSYFFPVGDIFKDVFFDWVDFLKNEKHFGYDMPLFPKMQLGLDENDQFKRECLSTEPLQSTDPIRSIFKKAFEAADIPYYNPHSVRDTLIRLGYDLCRTAEDFKCWSQNIGHSHMLTTFTSYGRIPTHKQGEVIKDLGKKDKEALVIPKNLEEFINKSITRAIGGNLHKKDPDDA